MNKYLLAITRYLHSLAVTLHLSGLRASIRAGERRVAKVIRNADLAAFAHDMAVKTMTETRSDLRIAKAGIRLASNAQSALISAARAEADRIASEHNVG